MIHLKKSKYLYDYFFTFYFSLHTVSGTIYKETHSKNTYEVTLIEIITQKKIFIGVYIAKCIGQIYLE